MSTYDKRMEISLRSLFICEAKRIARRYSDALFEYSFDILAFTFARRFFICPSCLRLKIKVNRECKVANAFVCSLR